MKSSIAIYGSHDASVSVRISSDEYKVYELERITGKRYYSLSRDTEYKSVLDMIHNFLETEHGITEYDSIFYCECDKHILNYIAKKFSPAHVEKMQHHFGHAACGLWQSDFDEALIISFDGGGWDIDGITYFNIFLGDKKTNSFKKIGSLPLDICSAYTMVAYPLASIEKKDIESYLAWAGKIMGLAGHGQVQERFKDAMRAFYYGNIDMAALTKLYSAIKPACSKPLTVNCIDGFSLEADIAATSQSVFEEIFFSAIQPYIHRYDLPIIITGGGALNVINNQSIYNKLGDRKLFIPCNPNDCGLALGFMLLRYPPDTGKLSPITYSGFPILDKDDLLIVKKSFKEVDGLKEIIPAHALIPFDGEINEGTQCSIKDLAELLVDGQIIGIIQGGSEVGPRALGNRSILAYPQGDVKEKINSKIKFREWYRPLSPVCRWEDADKYFHGPTDSKYMTYSQKVKTFLNKSIVHADDSARLQTVTQEQHPMIHELLSEVNALTGCGILINTSFNSKGKPILTTIKEALQVLKDTELDGVWVRTDDHREGYLFIK